MTEESDKFIILGDAHVGGSISIGRPGISSALNSKIQDQIKLLDWTLNTAVKNDVFNIILTGDVFDDAKPNPMVLNIFFDWLHRCSANGVDVHIIMGNHDIQRSGSYIQSALDLIPKANFENVHIYKDIETIHLNGVSITMMPFRDRRMMNVPTHAEAFDKLQSWLDYEVAEIPIGNVRVLVGHLALTGSIPVGNELDDVANELMCPLSLFKDYNYVWMGHIHRPQVSSRVPYIAHIGSMDISDFGEHGQDKIIILFDASKQPKFTELVLPTRNLQKIQISVPKDEETTAYIIKHLTILNIPKESTIKLEIKLSGREAKPVRRNEVEKFLYDEVGIHYISNFSETRSTIVVQTTQGIIDNTMDVTTSIKMYADNSDIPDFYKDDFLKEATETYNLYLEKVIEK